MKKRLIALLVLILGACSATDDTPVIPGGSTGDAAMDEGISDALDQIGSTDGMQLWRWTAEWEADGLKMRATSDLYEGTDTLKTLHVAAYDGKVEGEDITFDNEVASSVVSEGTFTKVASDTVTVKDDDNNVIIDFKGYNTIYAYTMTSVKYKYSKKVNSNPSATGNWETTPKDELETQYYLIKKADNKLYQIEVSKEEEEDTYTSYALSDDNATIFDKK